MPLQTLVQHTALCISNWQLFLARNNTIFLLGIVQRISVYGHTYSKSMVQPRKVANPARCQLNSENEYLPVHVRA